jgi:hypothetical protein
LAGVARGAQPSTPLAYALWSVTPRLADLFADLYTARDARLADALQGYRPGWGLALLALAEIGRGNAEGARLAHEPMMAFESEAAGAQLAARMAARLHGPEAASLHQHGHEPPLWKALALIAAHCGRCDLKAVLEVIRLLADPSTADPTLQELRNALDAAGIHFLSIDDAHVCYTQHGHAHKPESIKELGDMLLEIRQMRLG